MTIHELKTRLWLLTLDYGQQARVIDVITREYGLKVKTV